MSASKMVTLKDGSEVPYGLVVTTSEGISALLETKNHIALIDLILKCKDDQYKFLPNVFLDSRPILKKYELINNDEQVPEAIRKIVLNSFEGSKISMLCLNFASPLHAKEIAKL